MILINSLEFTYVFYFFRVQGSTRRIRLLVHEECRIEVDKTKIFESIR
jgi:hypothetical protein